MALYLCKMIAIINLLGLLLSLISTVLIAVSAPKVIIGFPNGKDLKEIAAQRKWKGKLYRISTIVLIVGIILSVFTHPLVIKVFFSKSPYKNTQR